MAKGRMINCSIAIDRRFNSCSLKAQWLYMRAIPFQDDHGRMTGDLFEWMAKVIPRNPPDMNFNEKQIRKLLNELQSNGLILWDENKVIKYLGFNKNQKIGHRPAESSYPDIGTKSKKPITVKEPEGFVEFWLLYPSKRRMNKEKCKKLYTLALKEISQDELLKALKSHIKYLWNDLEDSFIPHITRWFNDKRWEQEVKTPAIEKNEAVDVICSSCGYQGKAVMTSNTLKCLKCNEYAAITKTDYRILYGSKKTWEQKN